MYLSKSISSLAYTYTHLKHGNVHKYMLCTMYTQFCYEPAHAHNIIMCVLMFVITLCTCEEISSAINHLSESPLGLSNQSVSSPSVHPSISRKSPWIYSIFGKNSSSSLHSAKVIEFKSTSYLSSSSLHSAFSWKSLRVYSIFGVNPSSSPHSVSAKSHFESSPSLVKSSTPCSAESYLLKSLHLWQKVKLFSPPSSLAESWSSSIHRSPFSVKVSVGQCSSTPVLSELLVYPTPTNLIIQVISVPEFYNKWRLKSPVGRKAEQAKEITGRERN